MRKNLLRVSFLLLLVFSLYLSLRTTALATSDADEKVLNQAKALAGEGQKVEIVAVQKKSLESKKDGKLQVSLNPYTALGSYGDITSWLTRYGGNLANKAAAAGTSYTDIKILNVNGAVNATFYKDGGIADAGRDVRRGLAVWGSRKVEGENAYWEQKATHAAYDAYTGYQLAFDSTEVGARF